MSKQLVQIKNYTKLKVDNAKHLLDIGKESITPTTHSFRNILDNVSNSSSSSSSTTTATSSSSSSSSGTAEDIFYQDTYSHKTWGLEITRFGINSYQTSIRTDLLQHNQNQTSKIAAANLDTMSNASTAANYPKLVKEIDLTLYEQNLMKCALQYLFSSIPSHKVVLVDTFPRTLKPDSKKGLKLGDIEVPTAPDESLPTHTVVLYMSTKGEVLVVDPNNPKFSGHLKHYDKLIQISDNPSETHKIYSPKAGSTPGPKGDQYRDCVDIAVKLAVLLCKDTTHYTTHEEIMKSELVKLLSNNSSITKLELDKPLRIKQVSHLQKMQSINDYLQLINKRASDEETKALNTRKAEETAAKAKYDAQIISIDNQLELEVSKLIGQVAQDQDLEGSYA